MPESYTGDEGTKAAQAGLSAMDGTEDRRDGWLAINRTRDYVVQFSEEDRAHAAETYLPLWDLAAAGVIDPGKVPRYDSNGRIRTAEPASAGDIATVRWVEARVANLATVTWVEQRIAGISGGVPSSGGTFTGNVFFPNSSAATSGYTVAYINGDGRLSRGASSERYKKYISTIDPADLGDIWPDLTRYQMRGVSGEWKYGYIAERLAENADQQPFVVYREIDGELVPDSIDFIALLMAQNAQLHQRLTALEVAGNA